MKQDKPVQRRTRLVPRLTSNLRVICNYARTEAVHCMECWHGTAHRELATCRFGSCKAEKSRCRCVKTKGAA